MLIKGRALAAVDREHIAAAAKIEAADRRAARADQYVEALQRTGREDGVVAYCSFDYIPV